MPSNGLKIPGWNVPEITGLLCSTRRRCHRRCPVVTIMTVTVPDELRTPSTQSPSSSFAILVQIAQRQRGNAHIQRRSTRKSIGLRLRAARRLLNVRSPLPRNVDNTVHAAAGKSLINCLRNNVLITVTVHITNRNRGKIARNLKSWSLSACRKVPFFRIRIHDESIVAFCIKNDLTSG